MTWNDQKELEMIFNKVKIITNKTEEIIKKIQENTNGIVVLDNIGLAFNYTLLQIYNLYKNHNLTFYNAELKHVILFHLQEMVLEAVYNLEEYVKLFDVKTKEDQSTFDSPNSLSSEDVSLNQKAIDYAIKKRMMESTNFNAEKSRVVSFETGRDYGNSHHKQMSIINQSKSMLSIINQSKPMLEKYKRLYRNVLFFDIERDILKALQEYIEFNKKNGKEGGYDYYHDHDSIDEIVQKYNNELEALEIKKKIPLAAITALVTEQSKDNETHKTR